MTYVKRKRKRIENGSWKDLGSIEEAELQLMAFCFVSFSHNERENVEYTKWTVGVKKQERARWELGV
jgi:hypothetical protein